MKLFPILVLMLATLFPASAMAQKFVGYDLSTQNPDSLRVACKATQGTWTTYFWMGDNSQATTAATCTYKKQFVSNNTSADLIRPTAVDFIFDKYHKAVQSARFIWKFSTWARREDARNHFVAHMQDSRYTLTLSTGPSRIFPNIYVVHETPYYLKIVTANHDKLEVPEYTFEVRFINPTQPE